MKRTNWWKNTAGVMALSLLVGAAISGCSNISGTKVTKIEGVQAEAMAQYPEEPVYKDDQEQWEASREKRNKLTEQFAEAYEEFSVETTAKLFAGTDENMVYSPLSLYYALALAASGAEGETLEEMLDVLGYDDVNALTKDCKGSFEALYYVPNEKNKVSEYDTESRHKLTIANSIWADDAIQLKSDFAKQGAENFYADIFRSDLQSQETANAKAQWVKERTNGLIEPQATPASGEQILSIINTIYFYDEWMTRFQKENTKEDVFTCTDGTEVTCEFMNMNMGSHGFGRGENYTESSLSLKNGSMTFYLPDEGVDVRELVENEEILEGIMDGNGEYTSGQVTWKVPKFSYGSSMELAGMLKALGMEDAFLDGADFSGIADASTMFISNIRQDAHIGIDEVGVEGAAFTEIMFAGSAMPQGRADMILDRPFLYVVRKNGTVIFMGICENPTES